MAHLVRFAYPTAPENVMECLAVQTFVGEIRDEMITTRFTCPSKNTNDNKENVILGMNIMNAHVFHLDFKLRTIRIELEELTLHNQQEICAQMVLYVYVTLSERSELGMATQIEGNFVENLKNSKRVLMAKALIVLRHKYKYLFSNVKMRY